MPEYEDAYQRAIHRARRQALTSTGIPRQAYSDLYILYASFLRDIDRDLARDLITADRARALRSIINHKMLELGVRIAEMFDVRRRQAIDMAVSGHAEAVDAASRIAGVGVSVNFNQVPQRALDLMHVRRGLFGAADYRAVIRRNMVRAAPDIDRFLESVVARGIRSNRASQELAGILSGNDQRLLNLLDDGRLMKSRINRALRESQISPADFRRAKSVLHDARRIVVTETNTAFREADIQASWESPMVGAKRWQVSGRHYGLPSSPDVCTIYHELDQFGMGEGVFPIQNFPSTPHPWCGCRGEDVIREPDQWNEPKAAAMVPPSLSEGQLRDLFREKTPRHLERQVEAANRYQRLAYEFAQAATRVA